MSARHHRRGRGAVIAIAFAVLLAACGIPLDDRSHTIARDDVPIELLEAPPTTTTSTTMLEPGPSTTVATREQVPLYLVRNEHIQLIRREITSALGPADRLRLLSEPVPAAEMAQGFRSAVPPGAVNDVDLSGGVAQVDVSTAVSEVPSFEQILAFAQMTYTLTDLPGVGRVRFTLNGQPAQVLDDEGTPIPLDGTVSREDYENLFAS